MRFRFEEEGWCGVVVLRGGVAPIAGNPRAGTLNITLSHLSSISRRGTDRSCLASLIPKRTQEGDRIELANRRRHFEFRGRERTRCTLSLVWSGEGVSDWFVRESREDGGRDGSAEV